MGGKSSIWLLFVILAAVMLGMSRAFARPWRWDFSQIEFAVLLGAIVLAVASWGIRWWLYGTEGVKQRWNKFDRGVATELGNRPKMRRNFIFWIVIAIALVIYFNMTHQH